MGDLFYESMGITQILQFTVLTNVDVNGSQIVKDYCYWTMECLNVLSLWKCTFICDVREISHTIHNLVLWRIIIINPQICCNMPRKLVPRYRRGISDHIGHLIFVRDVPASGTSLLVVSPNLHAQRKGGPFRGRE